MEKSIIYVTYTIIFSTGSVYRNMVTLEKFVIRLMRCQPKRTEITE